MPYRKWGGNRRTKRWAISKVYPKTRYNRRIPGWGTNNGNMNRLARAVIEKRSTYTFTRTMNLNSTLTNPTVGAWWCANATLNGNGNFNIAQLPNYTEFTQLFDQYRITQIKMTWTNQANTYQGNNTPTLSAPSLMTCLDYDDGTALLQRNDFLQYETYKARPFIGTHSLYVKPKVATAVYVGALTTGYAQTYGNPWVDSANPSTPYYGCKWALIWPSVGDGATVLGVINLDIQFTIECRDTR
nr:MAG: capsid protein [Cressdnaviricota sp.]